MMHQEDWMKLRAFKPLRDAGASCAEIARAAGCEWRTAKKYLESESGEPPRYGPRRSSQGRMIDPYREVIDAWLRADPRLQASVIHERLAADPYGFPGRYQRVKVLGPDEHSGQFAGSRLWLSAPLAARIVLTADPLGAFVRWRLNVGRKVDACSACHYSTLHGASDESSASSSG
jgi:hypothetical protein